MDPAKIVPKLIINIILGVLGIFVINFFGGFFDFKIALNIFTAGVVGFLGIPGIALLCVLKFLVLA